MTRRALVVLDSRVDERVAGVVASRPDWPCQRGCSDCCRSLAGPHRISEPEWVRIRDAVDALAPTIGDAIRRALVELSPNVRHWTCPLLELERGVCRIYESRPLACRSYGFYSARHHDAWCSKIDSMLAVSGREELMVGNHDALDREIERSLGEVREIQEWARRDWDSSV